MESVSSRQSDISIGLLMQEGGQDPCSHLLSCTLAGTTRLELATSAVTVQRPEVTGSNFTAPIATRVCFEWRDGHAYEVEIVDYH